MQELILGESQRRMLARLQNRMAEIRATANGQIAGLQEAGQMLLENAIVDAGLPRDIQFRLAEDCSRLVAKETV